MVAPASASAVSEIIATEEDPAHEASAIAERTSSSTTDDDDVERRRSLSSIRDTNDRIYLKDSIAAHQIWHDGRLWEQTLWQCVKEQVLILSWLLFRTYTYCLPIVDVLAPKDSI